MTVMDESFQLKLRLNGKIASAFKEAMEGKIDVPEDVKKCSEEGVFAGLEELEWLHANRKVNLYSKDDRVDRQLHCLQCGCS